MKRIVMVTTGVLVLAAAALAVARDSGARSFREVMTGVKEVPVVSSTGRGVFTAAINEDETEIEYKLVFEGLETPITQSHIHIGPPNNTGNIDIFLCTNMMNGPAGTQLCPGPNATEGTIEGVITAANVLPLLSQGIAAGELREAFALMRAGVTYVNIHTVRSPAGEIRSQIHSHEDDSGHN
jgi:CHRD domain